LVLSISLFNWHKKNVFNGEYSIIWVGNPTNIQQYQDLQQPVCQNVTFLHTKIANIMSFGWVMSQKKYQQYVDLQYYVSYNLLIITITITQIESMFNLPSYHTIVKEVNCH
jgi:hypothetical protein